MTGRPAGKPTVADLGIDPAAQAWHRSGSGDGAIEVAFAHAAGASATHAANALDTAHAASAADANGTDRPDRAEWVLMRVAGDPEQRVLVFDRHEWECFLDGARKGEFDDATAGQ